ncbi:MAG: riboflavin synthase [Gammaproteobacteria bacterium]|nr:riboflavin synthase [Gammaproteobacteria bacterium]MBL7000851.1 riboflavin synthase [Gammaproteobacteria bacterium]
MFTGIIQAIGHIQSLEQKSGDVRLTLNSADLVLNDSDLGDSIAVNGVCLTAIAYTENGFSADVSRETLEKTSLGFLRQGSPVNLEKALTLNTALGGHLVSGHVDGLGKLISLRNDARSIRYEFSVPQPLAHYIAEKGSITIDGTSLTVNHVDGNVFGVNIVPHTRDHTVFQFYEINTQVNIEVDIIARYLERLLTGQSATSEHSLLKTLSESGFIK